MAINRAPFNALVDDDGSGTKGSPWNKAAIASVILDPVDAAIAAAAPTAPVIVGLYSGHGRATGAAAESLATVNVPALGLHDTLEIYWDMWIAGPAAVSIQGDLYASGTTASQLITLCGADAGPDLTGYAIGSYHIYIRPAPQIVTTFLTTAYGAVGIGTPQARGFVWTRNASVQNWNAPWTLLVRQISGLPAGTPLDWAASVYIRKG